MWFIDVLNRSVSDFFTVGHCFPTIGHSYFDEISGKGNFVKNHNDYEKIRDIYCYVGSFISISADFP